jgi:hypothetical protein
MDDVRFSASMLIAQCRPPSKSTAHMHAVSSVLFVIFQKSRASHASTFRKYILSGTHTKAWTTRAGQLSL